MTNLEQEVSTYLETRDSMSYKQKAEAERTIWDTYSASLEPGVPHGSKGDYLNKTLGEPAQVYERRQQLLAQGLWVNPLWQMLDDNHSESVIITLFRKARDLVSRGQATHEQAIQTVIDNYNNTGYEAKAANGKRYRRVTPTERVRLVNADHDPDVNFDSLSQVSKSKKFLLQLRILTNTFLKSSFEGRSSIEIDMISDEFISSVRESALYLQQKANLIRQNIRKDSRKQISRELFNNACEVLNLPFVYGKPIDTKLCRKTMQNRAKDLHPDRNGDAHILEYRAVIDAYEVLNKYASNLSNKVDQNELKESQNDTHKE